MTSTIVHLHGFGSSPASRKAVYLGAALRPLGVEYRVPDLNVPSFERLTLTAILEAVAAEVRSCPEPRLHLVGSSMGALAALHFADRYRDAEAGRVERMVFLAPAFDLGENRSGELGADWIERWEREGEMTVPHEASGGERKVHFGLVEDLRRYDSFAVRVDQPILIFHGRRDASVPAAQSERFAAGHPNVELRLLDDDHRLGASLEEIAAGIAGFLGLGPRRAAGGRAEAAR